MSARLTNLETLSEGEKCLLIKDLTNTLENILDSIGALSEPNQFHNVLNFNKRQKAETELVFYRAKMLINGYGR